MVIRYIDVNGEEKEYEIPISRKNDNQIKKQIKNK
tara:strand:- start:232 stop:336 length:105 start_codon:yes stop_codon:yes gene_type:complete